MFNALLTGALIHEENPVPCLSATSSLPFKHATESGFSEIWRLQVF
jgi:hypothetical protein